VAPALEERSASAWPEVFADDDPVRYESVPGNARRQGERVILPVFMADLAGVLDGAR